MRESVIERKVCDYAKAQGWLVRKMSYLGHNGCPDRFFFKGGRLLIVEFKAPGEVPTLQQTREHDRLGAEGFHVHVIDDVAAGCALFE